MRPEITIVLPVRENSENCFMGSLTELLPHTFELEPEREPIRCETSGKHLHIAMSEEVSARKLFQNRFWCNHHRTTGINFFHWCDAKNEKSEVFWMLTQQSVVNI